MPSGQYLQTNNLHLNTLHRLFFAISLSILFSHPCAYSMKEANQNNIKNINDLIKDRFELDDIIFTTITDPAQRRNIFRSQLETPRMQFHEECNDEFLDLMITIIKYYPLRSYNNICTKLSRTLAIENPENPLRLITKQHLINVVNELIQVRRYLKIELEIDKQRNETHYKDSLKANMLNTVLTRNLTHDVLHSRTAAPEISKVEAQKIWESVYPGEKLLQGNIPTPDTTIQPIHAATHATPSTQTTSP